MTDNALAGRCIGGVGGQGMDDAIVGCSVLGGCGCAVRWVVLMGGGRPRPCIGQRACRLLRLLGVTAVLCNMQCCWGVGGRAMDDMLAGRCVAGVGGQKMDDVVVGNSIWGDVAVWYNGRC